jgi:hypothetical protein
MQDQLEFWSVVRGQRDLLLRDGMPAAFRSADEALREADAHSRDELGKVSKDGYEWLLMDRTLTR